MRDAQPSLNLSTGMVEADLPKLGAQVRAQDWRMANAGVDWGSVASRTAADGRNAASTARPQVFQESVAYGDTAAARSSMAMSVREGAYFAAGAGNGAVFQDSTAYANAGARRPQGSQHPWMARDHQLARAEVAHEFELPDLRAARSMPTSVPRGGSAGKSGDCACGGNCGGKSGGSCNGACQGKGGGGASCGCGNKGAAVHGASAGNPWPLDDARHNLVLLAQELLLLEGHLADPERRCPSCLTKHALTVRALADEGRRLDGGGGLGPVWQQASALALSGDVQAVRGLRQGVVGVVAQHSGSPVRPDGRTGIARQGTTSSAAATLDVGGTSGAKRRIQTALLAASDRTIEIAARKLTRAPHTVAGVVEFLKRWRESSAGPSVGPVGQGLNCADWCSWSDCEHTAWPCFGCDCPGKTKPPGPKNRLGEECASKVSEPAKLLNLCDEDICTLAQAVETWTRVDIMLATALDPVTGQIDSKKLADAQKEVQNSCELVFDDDPLQCGLKCGPMGCKGKCTWFDGSQFHPLPDLPDKAACQAYKCSTGDDSVRWSCGNAGSCAGKCSLPSPFDCDSIKCLYLKPDCTVGTNIWAGDTDQGCTDLLASAGKGGLQLAVNYKCTGWRTE